MKLFLKRFGLWFLPVFVMYLLLETYITLAPNNFNARVKFLKANKADIEVLFLGSSHTQYGINQKFIKVKTANMAYAGQDYQLDNAIFFTYIKNLPKLRYLFIELDYFSLEEKIPKDFFKIPWYYKYHGIEVTPVSLLNKVSLYSSSPSFFNHYLADKLNPFHKTPLINEFGFSENDITGDFFKLKFDSITIFKNSKQRLNGRHSEESLENYNFNKTKLEAMIKYCKVHNIKVVIMKMPVYSTYRDSYNPKKYKRYQNYYDSIKVNSKFIFFDFEKSKDFCLKDFKDDDHLNEFGAKKLTLKINSFLQKEMDNTK